MVRKKIFSNKSWPELVPVGSVFFIKLTGAALGFISVFILVRVLGPIEYGKYAYVIAWLAILIYFSSLGMPQFIMKTIAISDKSATTESKFCIFRTSRKLVLTLSILLSFAVLLFGQPVFKRADTSLLVAFLFILFTLPVMTLKMVEQGAIRGAHQAARSFMPEAVYRPLAFLSLIAIFVAFNSSLSLSLVFLFYFTASVFALGFAIRYRRLFLPQFHHNKSSSSTKLSDYISLSKQSAPFLFLEGMNTIMISSATIIVGSIRGPKEAGIFSVSATITVVMLFVLVAVSSIFMPKMANYFKNGQFSQLKTSVKSATRYLVVFTLPLAVIFIFAGKYILYIFGPEFTVGVYVLACLSVGQLINISAGGMFSALNMSGHEQHLAKLIIITSLFTIVSGLMLTPSFGMLGTAFAIFLGYCLWVLMIFRRWKSATATFSAEIDNHENSK